MTRTAQPLLGIIPARGGSRGVPGKNIKLLGGVPLIAWAIRGARQSGLVDRLIVSTDDPKIAAVARAYGAEVPWLRPAELAAPDANMLGVVLHALERLKQDDGYTPDAVLLLQPTSPFRSVETIRAAVELYRRTGESIISVSPCRLHPYWSQRVAAEGRLEYFLPDIAVRTPRQDLPEAYDLNGVVHVTSRETILELRSFYSQNTQALVIPQQESLDIDTPYDWEAAESLWRARSASMETHPALIIAEAGVNHNGDIELAKRLVAAAAAAGADAVKFQTFKAEKVVNRSAPKARYQSKATGESGSQFDLIRGLELSFEQHRILAECCRNHGIQFVSTPFDEESADLLAELDVPFFKVPSGEITNRPLLCHIAAKRKPVILSTGMSGIDEVAQAVEWIRHTADIQLTLLHCVSQYPAPVAEINLRAMDTLRDALHIAVGYSDHALGIEVAVAAAARGATVIEKHLTLDRTLPGPDHQASIEPSEFAAMVHRIRLVESALGDGVKCPAPCEAEQRLLVRRSLVASRDLEPGHVLRSGDVIIKRPGHGIPPDMLDTVMGRTLRIGLRSDEVITWEAF